VLVNLAKDPAGAAKVLGALTIDDFALPNRAWANRQSGLSMGGHTEETAKRFEISRKAQDDLALRSHQSAVAARDGGFFDDLIVAVNGLDYDTGPRRDTSIGKLSSLPLAFDTVSGMGTLTAGNSSPLTDGAAALWVGDRHGFWRLDRTPLVQLIDWEIAAMDFRVEGEGILMAPARAIPRLLARHGLHFDDIAVYEIHEAFAAQVLGNIKAAEDFDYRLKKAMVDFDLGAFPWERVNPNGGSLALGHPFAATGARILSQAAKELADHPAGSRAIVSVCADGGQGSVALLERV
jgi:acetyl-CoA C-acetyltransferase/acetyl-CoA acyltransferase